MTEGVLERYRAVLSDPVLDGVDVRRLSATMADPSTADGSGVHNLAVILDKTRHLEDAMSAETAVSLVRGPNSTTRDWRGTAQAGGPRRPWHRR